MCLPWVARTPEDPQAYASGPPRQGPPVALSQRRKHGQRDGATCFGPSLTRVCGHNCPSVGVCGSHGLPLCCVCGVRGGGRQRRVWSPWCPLSTPLEKGPTALRIRLSAGTSARPTRPDGAASLSSSRKAQSPLPWTLLATAQLQKGSGGRTRKRERRGASMKFPPLP